MKAVRARVLKGPLHGKTIQCVDGGENLHIPVSKIGEPASVFVYTLFELHDGDTEEIDYFLIPTGSFWLRSGETS